MNKTGINMERVKKENRSLILKYINDNGPVSRIDIAEATGLTAASVTQITTALIASGILKELGSNPDATKSAGRKKILLDINPDAASVISVNIESEATTICISDIKGNIHNDLIRQLPTNKNVSPETFLSDVIVICKELLSALPKKERELVKCISIGTPGIVDRSEGIARHAYGIWDEPVDLRTIFAKELSLPLILSNNVNAFSTAEILYGIGKSYESLLVIKWGPGVGSAIVTDKRVYEGRHGKTAELGHFIVDKNGKKCSCGRRGCLETMLSYSALKEIADFKMEDFGSIYTSSTGAQKKAFTQAIDLFARSIVNTGALIAPNRIVLSGCLFKDEVIRNALIECCRQYDPAYNEKRICYTALNSCESYIGPVAVYVNDFLF